MLLLAGLRTARSLAAAGQAVDLNVGKRSRGAAGTAVREGKGLPMPMNVDEGAGGAAAGALKRVSAVRSAAGGGIRAVDTWALPLDLDGAWGGCSVDVAAVRRSATSSLLHFCCFTNLTNSPRRAGRLAKAVEGLVEAAEG